MKTMPLQKRNISSSRLVYGTTGLGGSNNYDPLTADDILKAERAIDAALETGITMFDHADIYTGGKAEAVFGIVLKRRPSVRSAIVLQSKCGIRFREGDVPQRYDFSKEHILRSVDGSLQRLETDYLDILLLHRPDPLMDPDEIAEAFERLKQSGKVRHFGVSNMNAAQMSLLQASLPDPLVANQLELNLLRTDWLDQGVLVNQAAGAAVHFADGVLEHCRLRDVQIQAWSPLAKGAFTGRTLDAPTASVEETRELVRRMAAERETSEEAIVLGWLMRHPATIQPVIGSANPERIRRSRDAIRVSETMTREEWYRLYVSARGNPVT